MQKQQITRSRELRQGIALRQRVNTLKQQVALNRPTFMFDGLRVPSSALPEIQDPEAGEPYPDPLFWCACNCI